MENQKIYRLSEREAKSLADETQRKCLLTFVELADWRNESGSTRQYVPHAIRKEAERTRIQPVY